MNEGLSQQIIPGFISEQSSKIDKFCIREQENQQYSSLQTQQVKFQGQESCGHYISRPSIPIESPNCCNQSLAEQQEKEEIKEEYEAVPPATTIIPKVDVSIMSEGSEQSGSSFQEENINQDQVNETRNLSQGIVGTPTNSSLPSHILQPKMQMGTPASQILTVQERCFMHLKKMKICFLKPLLAKIPGNFLTVFFKYPKFCKFLRDQSRLLQKSDEIPSESLVLFKQPKPKLKFIYAETATIYNAIYQTLLDAGFAQKVPTSGFLGHWNLLLTGHNHFRNSQCQDIPQLKAFNQYQRVNHFPCSAQIGHKDLMWRNLQKFFNPKNNNQISSFQSQEKIEKIKDLPFVPQTFVMPNDYLNFIAEKEQDYNVNTIWILKPNTASCGRGIKLLQNNSHVPKKHGSVISRYIPNPHLIDGLKYDLRIYALVSSVNPLKIYIYKQGLVRFATTPYKYVVNSSGTPQIDPNSLKDKFIHLTNYSVNKESENFIGNEQAFAGDYGSKWSLHALRKRYQSLGIDYIQVFRKIEEIVVKTIIAIEPHLFNSAMGITSSKLGKPNANVAAWCNFWPESVEQILSQLGNNNSNPLLNEYPKCPPFELYGFDVLLDSNLKPWLLEVNTSPSLSSSSPLDKRIKTMLISDLMHLIGLVMFNKKMMLPESSPKKSKVKIDISEAPKLNLKDILPTPDSTPQERKNQFKNRKNIKKLRKSGSNFFPTRKKEASSLIPKHAAPIVQSLNFKALQEFLPYLETQSERALIARQVNAEVGTIIDSQEEWSRSGFFQRVFPAPHNFQKYYQYFQSQKGSDKALMKWLRLQNNWAKREQEQAESNPKTIYHNKEISPQILQAQIEEYIQLRLSNLFNNYSKGKKGNNLAQWNRKRESSIDTLSGTHSPSARNVFNFRRSNTSQQLK